MSATTLPRRRASQLVLLSWGLGADSTAIITKILEDPAGHGFSPDLSELVVVVALTGDEWPDTMDLAERHILPLLRRHSVRLVQVARGGPSDDDGIVVMSDTREPQHLHRRGPWSLSDEMRLNGTVPQYAGGHQCSIKFKGWVIDRWVRDSFAGAPFRHIIGYEADEKGRAAKDNTYATATREPWHPLIDWGWDRARVLDYLRGKFQVTWPKSYCTFCPFPGVASSLPVHLERCRSFPELAAVSLSLEFSAMAFNPRMTLYKNKSFRSVISADGNTAALEALAAAHSSARWAVYEIRRIFFPARTPECHALHGKQCPTPLPGCRDHTRKGQVWRSLQAVFEGTRVEAGEYLRRDAALMNEPVFTVDGITRTTFQARRDGFPAVEGFLALAPAGVVDKRREKFDDRWFDVTGTSLALCGPAEDDDQQTPQIPDGAGVPPEVRAA